MRFSLSYGCSSVAETAVFEWICVFFRIGSSPFGQILCQVQVIDWMGTKKCVVASGYIYPGLQVKDSWDPPLSVIPSELFAVIVSDQSACTLF